MAQTQPTYVPCRPTDIPPAVRFDVPRRHQGQIVEVAYGGFLRSEHDDGDPYMRYRDRSLGPDAIQYYRLTTVLAPACWTQQEIAVEVATPQKTVDDVLSENGDVAKLAKVERAAADR